MVSKCSMPLEYWFASKLIISFSLLLKPNVCSNFESTPKSLEPQKTLKGTLNSLLIFNKLPFRGHLPTGRQGGK